MSWVKREFTWAEETPYIGSQNMQLNLLHWHKEIVKWTLNEHQQDWKNLLEF